MRGAAELRSTLVEPEPWLRDWLGGGKTSSGIIVDEERALRNSAVAACVRVVSETVADLPCITYERESTDAVRRAEEHPYSVSMRLSPNPEMTAFEYWENVTAYAMLWARSCSYINRRRNGSIELWPLPPNRVELAREQVATGAPGKYTPGNLTGVNVRLDNGDKRFIRFRDLLMVRAFGYAGEVTPIKRHAETIGLAMAAEEFGARFYGQGASSGGFIKMPVEATEGQANRTEARYRAQHEGLERAHLVGILEGGAEWQEVGISPRDAQYIEGRQYGVEEIARAFRVPLHKIQHLLRATFSNIEHQAIEFVTDSVGPWLTRHEQALRRDVYGMDKFGKPGDVFGEFLIDKLLRGDAETRGRAYALAVQWGWLTRNEVRRRENLSPIDGLDAPLRPLNMIAEGEEVDPADEPVRKLAALLSRNGGHDGASSDRIADYLAPTT